jgi:hypothetical protein
LQQFTDNAREWLCPADGATLHVMPLHHDDRPGLPPE